MSDVTRILEAIDAGDPHAAAQLLPLVYDELRRLAAAQMAREKPGHTFDATALVHEAYVRLVGPADEQRWEYRGHFFAAAAEAMRRILVEAARRKKRVRHGGGRRRAELPAEGPARANPSDDVLAVDEALEKLAAPKNHKCQVPFSPSLFSSGRAWNPVNSTFWPLPPILGVGAELGARKVTTTLGVCVSRLESAKSAKSPAFIRPEMPVDRTQPWMHARRARKNDAQISAPKIAHARCPRG